VKGRCPGCATAGVTRCNDICAVSPRLAAILFGAEDFATDMGIQRTAGGEEVLWARTQVAIACRAAGILAIDTPSTQYDDPAALERDMLLARSLGYRGKLCIHPAQVAVANRVFSPSAEELAAARHLIEAFDHQAQSRVRRVGQEKVAPLFQFPQDGLFGRTLLEQILGLLLHGRHARCHLHGRAIHLPTEVVIPGEHLHESRDVEI